ncbi:MULTISPECIES: hypothetical protein [unclassified Pseudofrankia]|uniref:hypothetical protein n=1 Tax=unclassified Pseudofrankia TaxID=2994372 RepID=UPI0008DADEDD|nr:MULTISPECIES: hypothetical protein [unclassified Pseudofrankia]MDT3442189.1 hypothetical protein [Pseudofrankia sp. BMG5.37]OHV43594.1 hypothetical protein BCD48_27880 [Pseudofrankia sp. BMG5.36]
MGDPLEAGSGLTHPEDLEVRPFVDLVTSLPICRRVVDHPPERVDVEPVVDAVFAAFNRVPT